MSLMIHDDDILTDAILRSLRLSSKPFALLPLLTIILKTILITIKLPAARCSGGLLNDPKNTGD